MPINTRGPFNLNLDNLRVLEIPSLRGVEEPLRQLVFIRWVEKPLEHLFALQGAQVKVFRKRNDFISKVADTP
ncbi:hypothetical protein EST38_g2328 [Candolleomyces aberdarensis]|uniref:Uncharacterized protein n=1 Tax=Candolleomyces aberdarensis TaxID=2316362 RepID=A0A4Q2DVU8_9AGAR|nr:hypothetical protein EST38_g2328 [Candolleomyces aberdarensis]